jgi:ribosome-associated protein
MLVVTPTLRIPIEELQFSFVRSSGPGGQNVNKLNTKAVLRWPVTTSPHVPEGVRGRFLSRYANRVTEEGELVLTSQRFRDQRQNQRDCIEKLRAMLLAVASPPRKRKPTKPTRASVRKNREKKQAHSRKKSQRGRVRFDE